MIIFGKERNIKLFIYEIGLPALIILDLLLITISIIFEIPNYVLWNIQLFDFVVCIILLGEYFLNLYMSSPKKDFIFDKENIIGLIASIPFDFILPLISPIVLPVTFLRYLRLFKLIRVFNLAKSNIIKDLFKKTGLHKILGCIVLTILIFTLLFMLFGPSYGGFNDFYYVIVTLTTVGYGDIFPKTYNEKVLAIILIIIGIFVYSTITAAISSFLTDRILTNDEKNMSNEIEETINEKFESIIIELKSIHDENKQLKNQNKELKTEINELKEIIHDK